MANPKPKPAPTDVVTTSAPPTDVVTTSAPPTAFPSTYVPHVVYRATFPVSGNVPVRSVDVRIGAIVATMAAIVRAFHASPDRAPVGPDGNTLIAPDAFTRNVSAWRTVAAHVTGYTFPSNMLDYPYATAVPFGANIMAFQNAFMVAIAVSGVPVCEREISAGWRAFIGRSRAPYETKTYGISSMRQYADASTQRTLDVPDGTAGRDVVRAMMIGMRSHATVTIPAVSVVPVSA
jgi:hypothetical protein